MSLLLLFSGAGTSTSTTSDVDAVLTRKQLEALRRKIKEAHSRRKRNQDEVLGFQGQSRRELRTMLEQFFSGVAPDEADEIVAVIPKAARIPSTEIAPPGIDWNMLLSSRAALNGIADVLQRIIDIRSGIDREQFERDEEMALILLMSE